MEQGRSTSLRLSSKSNKLIPRDITEGLGKLPPQARDLEEAVLGALMAQDLALFVVFFDLMLVPFFFLTGQWGEGRRVQATMKLVIYTLVGSLLMLVAILATAFACSRWRHRASAVRLTASPGRSARRPARACRLWRFGWVASTGQDARGSSTRSAPGRRPSVRDCGRTT